MKVVYAYYFKSDEPDNEKKNFEAQRLVNKRFRSYRDLIADMNDGEHATVEVTGKGYKTVNIKDGQGYIQRNFVHEY